MDLFFTEFDFYIYVYMALYSIFVVWFSQVCLLEWGITFKF